MDAKYTGHRVDSESETKAALKLQAGGHNYRLKGARVHLTRCQSCFIKANDRQ